MQVCRDYYSTTRSKSLPTPLVAVIALHPQIALLCTWLHIFVHLASLALHRIAAEPLLPQRRRNLWAMGSKDDLGVLGAMQRPQPARMHGRSAHAEHRALERAARVNSRRVGEQAPLGARVALDPRDCSKLRCANACTHARTHARTHTHQGKRVCAYVASVTTSCHCIRRSAVVHEHSTASGDARSSKMRMSKRTAPLVQRHGIACLPICNVSTAVA